MLTTFSLGSPQHAPSELRRAAQLVAQHAPSGPNRDGVLASIHMLQKGALRAREENDDAIFAVPDQTAS